MSLSKSFESRDKYLSSISKQLRVNTSFFVARKELIRKCQLLAKERQTKVVFTTMLDTVFPGREISIHGGEYLNEVSSLACAI